MAQAGFTQAQIARIDAPIGLDLGARSPAEIAVAILAQMTDPLAPQRAVKAAEHPNDGFLAGGHVTAEAGADGQGHRLGLFEFLGALSLTALAHETQHDEGPRHPVRPRQGSSPPPCRPA